MPSIQPPDDDSNRPGGSQNDLSGSSRDVVQAGSVAGGIHFHTVPAVDHSSPTPRQLPADTRTFVNRTDELRELNAVVASPQDDGMAGSVLVVAGTAGAGKTSLALRWAHQVKHLFPDGQLFVNLRGYDPGEPVTARQAITRFLRALGVPSAEVPQDRARADGPGGRRTVRGPSTPAPTPHPARGGQPAPEPPGRRPRPPPASSCPRSDVGSAIRRGKVTQPHRPDPSPDPPAGPRR